MKIPLSLDLEELRMELEVRLERHLGIRREVPQGETSGDLLLLDPGTGNVIEDVPDEVIEEVMQEVSFTPHDKRQKAAKKAKNAVKDSLLPKDLKDALEEFFDAYG